jgi:hypothetical protein
MKRTGITVLATLLLLTAVVASAQQSPPSSKPQTMQGMDMPAAGNPQAPEKSSSSDAEMPASADPITAAAMNSMSMRNMDMGPHMHMTRLRELRPGDQERADAVVAAARKVGERYVDYHTALADGFKIFLPNVPQKMYHFTNYRYAFEAAFWFNPDHPTSLLYEKHGDDYKLIGVMYTAPKRATPDELDKRIPLSIARWHAHVNLCLPPDDKKNEAWGPHPRFGLNGSISTREECEDAGGRFIPQIFGWMVHVYPFEKDPAQIWSVERQMGDDNPSQ